MEKKTGGKDVLFRKIFNDCLSLLKKSSEPTISAEEGVSCLSSAYGHLTHGQDILQSVANDRQVVKKWIQALHSCLNHSARLIRVSGFNFFFPKNSFFQTRLSFDKREKEEKEKKN